MQGRPIPGRSIRIFLVDGVSTGIMTTEIMNWTGKVIVAPRTQLVSLAKRNETLRPGIYVLTGEDSANPLKDKIYIGESENVLKRLKQHNADPAKEFWNRTALVISKDENLTKSHIRYLESRLIQIAAEAGRATLENGTAPDTPGLPEPDVADMEYFLEQFLILLPVLNFSFATPVPTTKSRQSTKIEQSIAVNGESSIVTFVASGFDYKAIAQEIDGQFLILKGSAFRKESKNSLRATYREMREQLVKDKTLIETADHLSYELKADISLPSPSGAAGIVTGTTINGREFWKLQGTDKTYNQWDQERIDQVSLQTEHED